MLRIGLDDPDLLDPWVSDFAADRRPIASRANALLAMGLSMWTSAELADEANRLVLNTPYDAVASVRLDGDRGIYWARTGPTGHYTVWGRPDQLRQSVLDVHPV
jgi:hypothetical protein